MALVALHWTLLQEHHDFFLASQHPSASMALKRLANKYAMPARMWRHGIHSVLELLPHRLPYFPNTWFTASKIDDDEKYVELGSKMEERKERILWLGRHIARAGKWLTYNAAVHQFDMATVSEIEPIPPVPEGADLRNPGSAAAVSSPSTVTGEAYQTPLSDVSTPKMLEEDDRDTIDDPHTPPPDDERRVALGAGHGSVSPDRRASARWGQFTHSPCTALWGSQASAAPTCGPRRSRRGGRRRLPRRDGAPSPQWPGPKLSRL